MGLIEVNMKNQIAWRWVFTIILLCQTLVQADGLLVIHDMPDRRDHFAFAPLEVAYHRVEVQIDDQVATTRVDQAFHNPTDRRLEGTYIFPLPQGATIDKFSMDIDGTMTSAELLDAAKAKATYEEIVRKYRDPALLEYVGRGAMKVRVFPIEPNSNKRIQISYTQVLKPDSGLMEYSYPLNTEKFSAKPLKDVSVRVRLNSNTPIKSIYSPTHDIDIRRDGTRGATIGFEAKDVRPDIDFKLMVAKDPNPVGLNLLTWRNGSGDGYFMLLASPGDDVSPGDIQAKDICFVLDTSGSMAGAKLEQAKKALKFCLANLNSEDRFEVVRFSTEAESLFGKLEAASRENLKKAGEFVDQLKPIGGTAIEDALKKARDSRPQGSRPFTVVFLTDGQPTVGNTNEDVLVKLAGSFNHTRMFPFGIGTDINTTLLDRFANDTHAFSQYVLPTEDIEVKVSNFYSKIQSPVLTDVKMEVVSGNIRLSQIYPGMMPDLFRGDTLIAFGRYTGSGNAELRMSGMRDGSQTSFSTRAEFTASDTRNAFIPRLWATRRVGWLLDEIRLRGESKELKDEITQLAREHGIVTPYTAYLIIEDERRRNVPTPARTMREMEEDGFARQNAAGAFNQANAASPAMVRTGDTAVTDSVALNSLKLGVNVQQSQQSQRLDKGGLGLGGGRGGVGVGGGMVPASAPAGYKDTQNYAQQVRVVNGRAFYQNGRTWTDNTAQTQQNVKRQDVKFNSEEYFALLNKYPSAIPWFSLGDEVDIILEDTLYVVR